MIKMESPNQALLSYSQKQEELIGVSTNIPKIKLVKKATSIIQKYFSSSLKLKQNSEQKVLKNQK